MTYDFSLDRKATVTVSAGSVLLLMLVFLAGFLTGFTWRSDRDVITAAKPAPAAARNTAAGSMPPGTSAPQIPAAPPTAEATAAAEPTAPPPAQPAVPAAPAASPASETAATAAGSATALADGVQLAVQVGAFLEKANADKLAERLREEGYAPQIVLGGHARQWNFVRVGPYHDWDEASQIAAVLSRDQATQAVVRPMR
jgi:cell division protein FtsN